ncbi:MAG: hypothetical protein RLZZ152_2201, partial [Pseudomonadota bacterium]
MSQFSTPSRRTFVQATAALAAMPGVAAYAQSAWPAK